VVVARTQTGDGVTFYPERASNFAGPVDHVTLFLLAVCGFFAALIAALIVFFSIKYHHTKSADRSNPSYFNLPIEIVWTAVPLALCLVMFAWGARLFVRMHQAPSDAIDVDVVGKQWMWKIQHPEGRREINELHVPVGRPVKLLMTSEDVIHSFFVPAFRIKQDVLPDRYTSVWFRATKAGSYPIFCAQLCGAFHAQMIGTVIAMPGADYDRWAATPSTAAANATPNASGQTLFAQYGCASCHGARDQKRGPSLVGIFGRTVHLENGATAVADENYLRESIVRPRARVVAGYAPLMPTYDGELNEEQIQRLIAYLKSGDNT
jgi:cytochrome c oxidase subunit 2